MDGNYLGIVDENGENNEANNDEEPNPAEEDDIMGFKDVLIG